MPSRPGHVVAVPGWFTALRITQLILALIVLGLNAYHLHYDTPDEYIYSISIASATIITSIYHLVATLGSTRAYNGLAILTLDILFLILWLISFSHAAALTSDGVYDEAYSYECYGLYDNCRGVMVAVPVVGAVESLLFLAALTTFSIALHRHRRAGLPLRPNSNTPPLLYTTHPHYSGPANGNGIPLEKTDSPAQTAAQQQQQSAYKLNTASPLAQSRPQSQSPPPPQHQPFYHGQSSPIQPQSPITSPFQPAPHSNASVYTPSPITSSRSLVSPIGTLTSSGGGGGGAAGGRYYQRPADGAQELQTNASMPQVSELGTWRGA